MQSQQKKLTDEITKTKNRISEYERKQKALEHTKPKETAEWKSIQRQIKKADEAAESYAKQLQKIEKEHIDSFMDIDPKRSETLGIEAAQSTKEYQKLYDAMVKAQDKSESLTGNLKGTQQYQSTDGLQAQKLANLDRIGEAKDKLETLERKLEEVQQKNSVEGSQKLFKSMKSNAAKAFNTISSGAKTAMNGLKKLGTIGANAFRKLRDHAKSTNKSTNGLASSVAKMQKRMLGLAKTVLVYQMMRTALRGLRDYMGSMLKTNKQFTNSLSAIKGNLQTAFYPIYQTIMPILNTFMGALVKVTGYLATFFNTLLGHNVKTSAGAIKDQADATKDLADATKKANKELYSFDEINKQSDNSDSSSSGSGGSGITTDVADTADVSKMVEMIKQAWRDSDFTELGEIVGGKIKDGLDSIKWDQVQQTAVKIAACIATFINGALSVSGLDTSIGKTIGEAINTGVLGLDTFLKTVNWAQVGTFIAGTLNSAIATTSWAGLGGTICDGINAFFGTSTNFATHFDFSNLGASVGELINGAITKIDWGTALFGAKAWGVGIANTINTAVSTTSWDAVGSTIGNSLSTIIATAHSFIKTVDVKAMAAGIATAINNALKTTDFEALGDTIGTAIGNLAGSIATFLKTVDWSKVAKAVLDTLKGVFKGITEDSDNMKAIGAIVATLIGAAIAKQAAASLFTSAAAKIISAISGGLEGSTSWASLGSTVMSKLSTNLTSKVSTLLNDQVFLAKFASIGTTIATCVGTAIAGFELGKNLGSYLFPEDADYYDNFKWSDFFSKFNKEDAKGAWKEFITEITGGETKGHKAEIDFSANEDSIRGVNKKVNDGLKTSDVAAGAGKVLDVGIQTTPDTAKIASTRATIANGFTGKNQVSASIKSAVDTGSANTARQNIVKSFANVSTSIKINKATNLKKVKSDIRSSMKKTNASFKVQADTNSIKQAKNAIQDGLQGISITATGKITWESGQTSQIAVDKNGKHHTIYKAMGGILGSSGWLPITRYATGGLPKSAEMFMAREAGPELVGRIGSRTAVVNNDQIVASVSEGVYRAVVAALGSGGNQQAINLALRLIMDGKQTTQIVIDRINEMIDTTGQIPIRI
nr:MAG TPA: minor tail protein [Caudoviricetes sp.]